MSKWLTTKDACHTTNVVIEVVRVAHLVAMAKAKTEHDGHTVFFTAVTLVMKEIMGEKLDVFIEFMKQAKDLEIKYEVKP